MKLEEFELRHPRRNIRQDSWGGATQDSAVVRRSFSTNSFKKGSAASCSAAAASFNQPFEEKTRGGLHVASMGMAAGGRMKQQVFEDPYNMGVWSRPYRERTFVHLLNSRDWRSATGKEPPHAPISPDMYARRGYPWFSYYSDAPTLDAGLPLATVKSAAQMASEKGEPVPVDKPTSPHEVKDGNW